jgi:hypothetical protein
MILTPLRISRLSHYLGDIRPLRNFICFLIIKLIRLVRVRTHVLSHSCRSILLTKHLLRALVGVFCDTIAPMFDGKIHPETYVCTPTSRLCVITVNFGAKMLPFSRWHESRLRPKHYNRLDVPIFTLRPSPYHQLGVTEAPTSGLTRLRSLICYVFESISY